jgi:hypothetical protein
MIFKETKRMRAFRILRVKAETEPNSFQHAWHSNAFTDNKGTK